MDMDEEQKRMWEEWVSARPPRVAAVARAYPPDCYRVRKNDGGLSGHYLLMAFDEPEDDTEPVTVKILHGADSFLPGMLVFGHPPEDLVRCGCGKWEEPTQEEANTVLAASVALAPLLGIGEKGH